MSNTCMPNEDDLEVNSSYESEPQLGFQVKEKEYQDVKKALEQIQGSMAVYDKRHCAYLPPSEYIQFHVEKGLGEK